MAEQIRKRAEIDAQYKWDLSHIFPTVDAWEAALAGLTEEMKAVAAFDGKVKDDPRAAIRACYEFEDKLMPVFEYAFLNKETDNGDAAAQAMSDRVRMMCRLPP